MLGKYGVRKTAEPSALYFDEAIAMSIRALPGDKRAKIYTARK